MVFRRPVRTVFVSAMMWAALAISAGTSAWAEAAPEDLASFDQIWTTIRDTHWQQPPGGLDWEAIRREYRPRVEQSSSTEEARAVMTEMLGRLHQTHFKIVPAEEYQTTDPGQTGIELRVLDGEAVVTAVNPGSPAERAGVHRGWIIEEIATDGAKTTTRALIEQTPKDPLMPEVQLTRALEKRLTGVRGDFRDVTFLDGNKAEVRLHLPLATPRGTAEPAGNLPPTYVWYEYKRLGDIGYIHFNRFLDEEQLVPDFQGSVEDCQRCEGLIIDLRGNTGGATGMAARLAAFLSGMGGKVLGASHSRTAKDNFFVPRRREGFVGPVAVLIDGNSASTSEILASGLQGLARARVFGTRSAAAALVSLFVRLPNGDGFQYAVAYYVSPSGQTIEGQGVRPDEEVRLTRAGLLADHDAVVDAAVTWIEQQRASKKRAGAQPRTASAPGAPQ